MSTPLTASLTAPMAAPLNVYLTDCVQSFQVEETGLRGRLVRVGPALRQAMAAHKYPALVEQLAGEAVAVALTLASVLKYDGIFTFQATGDGAVSTLMADVTTTGAFRCYARYDADALKALTDLTDHDSQPSLPRLMGAGHLSFTVDQGPDTERYQGITELSGGTLAECAHHYFRQLEQIQTAMVALFDDTRKTAGTIMIQQLPTDDIIPGADTEETDDWCRAVILMSSVRPEELLDETLPPGDILYRLFHEDGVRLFDSRPVRNECRCSETRVRNTLKSFRRDEIQDMLENNMLSVTCEFCLTDYVFDPSSLNDMFADG